jgi:hypothetical protein
LSAGDSRSGFLQASVFALFAKKKQEEKEKSNLLGVEYGNH